VTDTPHAVVGSIREHKVFSGGLLFAAGCLLVSQIHGQSLELAKKKQN
jgi:hypothetical protein